MKPYILRNVTLDPNVEAFVKEHYTIVDVSELTPEIAADIEVLLTNGTGQAPKSLLDKLPSLKLIDDFGVGYDGVDIEECKKRGITVCNTPGVLTEDVADLAITLLLSSSRNIVTAANFVKAGRWAKGDKFGLSRKVSGKKAGIVGLGRIGKAVAQRLKGFDMQIFYYDIYAEDQNYTKVDNLEKMAGKVDFLIICAAATSENKGLISESVMKALGSEGTLVNVSRGSLVDEKALVKLIKEKAVGAAALDVFVDEPNAPEELFGLDNVILTPHVASATIETRKQMAQIVIDNLKAFREGTDYVTALF